MALPVDHAKALTGGRLHDHPARRPVRRFCTQFLKARHLGRDVVSLDINVDPTLMLGALVSTFCSSGGVSSMR